MAGHRIYILECTTSKLLANIVQAITRRKSIAEGTSIAGHLPHSSISNKEKS